jgi:hypothetical protein
MLFSVSVFSSTVAQPPMERQVNTQSVWNIETVDSDGNVGGYTSLALDSGDNPHISYVDWTNDYLKYARWTGSTWSVKTVDSGVWGFDTSLALDSSGNPHISYFGDGLQYARWNGTGWSIETVASDGGSYTSIALDSRDRPHISYFDGINSDLKYAWRTGAGWNIETVDDSFSYVGTHNSIALDSGDNPHISYCDFTITNDYDLKYAWRTYFGWWSGESVESVGHVGEHTSLALDSGDNPHISYYDWPYADLKYARWTGTTWSIEWVDLDSVGHHTSLALDSGDCPHISYYDMGNRDLKYARWNGTGWSIEIVDSDGHVGEHTSLALDSGDNPHISYYDNTNGDLKYAYGDLRTPTILKLTISPSEAHPGEWITISGVLTPELANEGIFLFYRINKWKCFALANTNQQGHYSLEIRIPESVKTPKTVSFVAFYPGTDIYIGAVSPIRKLSITSPLT